MSALHREPHPPSALEWCPILLVVGIVALGADLVTLVACDHGPSIVDGEVENLKRRAVPLAGRIVWETAFARDLWSVSTRWEVEVPWTWDRYAAWMMEQLPSYHSRPCRAGLVFSRVLPGDVFSVCARPATTGPPLRVTLEFAAHSF